jgi:hypothetical protein
VGPLPAATARRLAGDAALTRVLVTRDRDGDGHNSTGDLAARLRTAMTLPPRCWVVPDRNRWRWAAPPGWSLLRSAPR